MGIQQRRKGVRVEELGEMGKAPSPITYLNVYTRRLMLQQPKHATPHHLVFLADPQLIDPHSYPGRPWFVEKATIAITDNYLKRSYMALQEKLHPDTIFFLGDLFDGGREWKTAQGNTKDPMWANGLRPSGEQAFVESWGKRYGEDFWLHEYDRFGRIFYKFWNLGGEVPGKWQRGRKIISTLPGNHDLGFGAQIKIPVRNRFEVYFGEGNRVDVVGNHTFVSIDAVSLSASGDEHGTKEITDPVENFLKNVQATKRKAVARELSFLAGEEGTMQFKHAAEDLSSVDFTHLPTLDPGPSSQIPDLPTILLTHVPLYRAPGTPCGPLREHHPPLPLLPGQTTPTFPDHRNAISVSKGYQYQNVLSESDSLRVVSSIGNVKSVFSGDDHDYCELVHPEEKNGAREVTVKSMSMAMGVRKPGFLMLSLWNPVGAGGEPLLSSRTGHGAGEGGQVATTMESHLCLQPDEIGILITYGYLVAFTILVLIVRAVLVPILHLTPFSSPSSSSMKTEDESLLPISNKRNEKERNRERSATSSTSSTSSNSNPSLAPRSTTSRTPRSNSPNGYGLPPSNFPPPLINSAGYTGSYIPPVFTDQEEEKEKQYGGAYNKEKQRGCSAGLFRSGSVDAGKSRKADTQTKLVLREIWQSVWRVTWVVVGVYCWLGYFG